MLNSSIPVHIFSPVICRCEIIHPGAAEASVPCSWVAQPGP